jgi:hypothetical protein
VDDMVWAAPWLFLGLLGVITKSGPYRAGPLRDEVAISDTDEPAPNAAVGVWFDEVPIRPSEPVPRLSFGEVPSVISEPVAPASFDEVPITPPEPGVGLPEASDQRTEFDVWLADFFEDRPRTDEADTPDGHAGG